MNINTPYPKYFFFSWHTRLTVQAKVTGIAIVTKIFLIAINIYHESLNPVHVNQVIKKRQLLKVHLVLVVRKVDNTIHRINHYPVASVVCFVITYPLDSDLSGG